MSEVEQKPAVVEATEPTTAAIAESAVEPLAPTTNTDVEAAKPEVEAPSTSEPAAAPAAEKEEEKTIEPVTEGQLAYKGPGLVKSLIPSKKEFWLSDEAVAPENLSLYLRGEKPEIAHPVVAWASQTGKGLLFSTKKNADRTHPSDVLALYDATDLKKQSPHEFSFKLNGHNHVFKAANDTERDGWYISIEKAIELAKASKDEIIGSENYKAETEKLTKPTVVAAGRGTTKPADGAAATEDAEESKKSRGKSPFARFARKKDEVSEKKEAEQEDKPAEEAAPVSDATAAAPVVAATAAAGIPAAQEASKTEEAPAVAAEDKPKPAKRGSIFGKLMSPTREKSAKDAELKTEAPKDAAVSENPPQLPETSAETAAEPVAPVVAEPAAESKETETATPSKEKTNFLSSFMKRGRSVSPSTAMKDAPAKTEEPAAVEEATTTEPAATEPAKTEEPAATEPAVEEPKKDNKRQSVLGSLGRRASKALNRMQTPSKKENVPAATEAKEESTEIPVADNPVVNGTAPEVKPEGETIGDVVPEAVTVGQQPVTASA